MLELFAIWQWGLIAVAVVLIIMLIVKKKKG